MYCKCFHLATGAGRHPCQRAGRSLNAVIVFRTGTDSAGARHAVADASPTCPGRCGPRSGPAWGAPAQGCSWTGSHSSRPRPGVFSPYARSRRGTAAGVRRRGLGGALWGAAGRRGWAGGAVGRGERMMQPPLLTARARRLAGGRAASPRMAGAPEAGPTGAGAAWPARRCEAGRRARRDLETGRGAGVRLGQVGSAAGPARRVSAFPGSGQGLLGRGRGTWAWRGPLAPVGRAPPLPDPFGVRARSSLPPMSGTLGSRSGTPMWAGGRSSYRSGAIGSHGQS